MTLLRRRRDPSRRNHLAKAMDPGSAAHHFVLRSVRGTRPRHLFSRPTSSYSGVMARTAKPKTPVDVAKLTKAQAKVELMRLTLEIEGHNERYYQKDAPTVSDAAYDALRQRLEAIETKFPDLVTGESPSQKVGAAPARGFAQNTARRSHAVARQCLQRRGRDRVRRARQALSQARCRAYSRPRRRAEDRRPVAVAALRERRTGPRGDARRRFYRRGRHRQRPHHQGHSAHAERPQAFPRPAKCAAKSTCSRRIFSS